MRDREGNWLSDLEVEYSARSRSSPSPFCKRFISSILSAISFPLISSSGQSDTTLIFHHYVAKCRCALSLSGCSNLSIRDFHVLFPILQDFYRPSRLLGQSGGGYLGEYGTWTSDLAPYPAPRLVQLWLLKTHLRPFRSVCRFCSQEDHEQ